MAQENTNNGFTLPEPGASEPVVAQPQGSAETMSFVDGALPVADTLVRDLAIGTGSMLVLMVVFFFMKSAYSQSLVRKKRFSPNDANSAAWWLFGFLSSTSFAVLVMIISPEKFMQPEVMCVLAVISLLTLTFTWRSSRR